MLKFSYFGALSKMAKNLWEVLACCLLIMALNNLILISFIFNFINYLIICLINDLPTASFLS